MRALTIAVVLAACGGSQVNVAPAVQPAMYRIADKLVSLDRAIEAADPAERQKSAVAAIDVIAEITRELATGKLRESHELMRDEIDGFLAEIDRAREAAAATPPNYYWAGKIHATCVRCHDPEGGIWDR